MALKKIDLIFGTRPEAIKMAILCRQFKQSPEFETRVISTGQHKEMLEPILKWFEISPDVNLDLMTKNQTLSSLTSKCLTSLQAFFDTNGLPDVILVQGDTTTAFVSALAAFYNKVKIGHVEAGLRTYNKFSPWPEEMNRTIISRLADFHFTPTMNNHAALLNEGVASENIFNTGNTVLDALLFSERKILTEKIYGSQLSQFYTGDKKDSRIVLITGHRRENFGGGFELICKAIRRVSEAFPDVNFIYPVHLNPNVRSTVMSMLGGSPNIFLIDPLGYPEFVALMIRSYIILTDSGGIQEEGPSLGKPVLVMRENTERPEALAYGTVKLVGTDPAKIYQEVSLLLTDNVAYAAMAKNTNPYGDGKSAQRIVDIIKSAR